MKNIVLLFVVAFAFCPMTIASDIAISTQANWWSQTAADREMQEIADNVTAISVELFAANEQDALADWIADHTGDGTSDLLILCGVCPASIYAAGNAQPDGSLAELFLDDGNCIINTGDWIFYVGSAGNNGVEGLPNIMDISSMEMWDDNTPVTVTAEGQQYTPSLTNFQTDRAIHIDSLEGDWYAELILALADDGNRAEPVILHNSATGGRIGVFFQTASQDNDPRGEVISEWINNWYLKYVASANPFARRPNPTDGTIITETWVTFSWQAGDFAASHDVYFGDSFGDVNDGTRESETFRGNQDLSLSYGVAGFAGYPYPDGLVPGTTYYWRIDEVNDTDPNSPWKGKVWSFTVPSLKAHFPIPGDGSRFIDNKNLTLTWTPGFGAKFHTIYFGDDYDTVANAIVGTPLVVTSYKPGTLELEKTYYWRVDENDGTETYTGDVWSFKTLPDIPVQDPNLLCWWKLDEGQGATALDWSGYGHNGTLLGDPQWVLGYDGGALEFDGGGDYVNFGNTSDLPMGTSARSMCGWAKTDSIAVGWRWIAAYGSPVTSQAMFIGMNTDDLYGGGYGDDVFADGFWEVNVWHHICLTYDGTTARLYADGIEVAVGAKSWNLVLNRAHIGRQVNDYVEFWDGLIDDVRIYNKTLTPDEIIKVMVGDPMLVWNANPANGSTPDIQAALPLSWSPGDMAAQHDVYFGTDGDGVADADNSTADIYRGRQSTTSYIPPEGIEWGGGPYYWRVDEFNTDGTVSKGRVWSFTVADYLSIDDFEDYDAGDNQIWYAWHDGLGYGTQGTQPYFAGNGTGSVVGDETTTSYTEESIVNSGAQSMPFSYDNNKQGYAKYSEVEMTLTSRRDWTEQDVVELSLWFRGYPASVGSFVEGPAGTYTITASGADIWDLTGLGQGYHDEFHFAYKTLSGPGSIVAKVVSVDNTNVWAKAGVMIRETLDPDSVHAFACITPGNGVAAQGRYDTGGASFNWNQSGIAAPHWLKLERDISGNFTVSHSTNGTAWQPVQGTTQQNVPMSANVYIGLALTAHDATLTCQAVFSNVTTTGNVGTQWAHQDIGILSNDAEPMYVAISNSAGSPAVVYYDNPDVATIDTWTEWVIPLQTFTDQGINLTDVDRIAIGLGTKGNMTIPGGSGKMFFDDIRLYRPGDAEE